MKKIGKHGKAGKETDEMVRNLLKPEQADEFCLFAEWQGWKMVCAGPGELLHLEKHGRHARIFYEVGEYTFFQRELFPLLYAYISGIAKEAFVEYAERQHKGIREK